MQRKDILANLKIAEEAARFSGIFLMENFKKKKRIISEERRDIKLDLDVKSEEVIINHLRKNTNFPILAEESGQSDENDNSSGYLWIVDPLDGSVNYFRGIPLFTISIALYHEHNPVLGLIYDLYHDQIYKGIPGVGAWLNEKPIHVSTTSYIENAIVCTGFPSGTKFSKTAMDSFSQSVLKFRKVRLLGSAALSLAFVSSGVADAYFERDIKWWDVAAGIALVQAAGGKVIMKESSISNGVTVFATNEQLPYPFESNR